MKLSENTNIKERFCGYKANEKYIKIIKEDDLKKMNPCTNLSLVIIIY